MCFDGDTLIMPPPHFQGQLGNPPPPYFGVKNLKKKWFEGIWAELGLGAY